MLFFQAFGAESFWFAVLATAGLLLAGAALYYSIVAYPKPGGAAAGSGEEEETADDAHGHDEPGVPLILKWVYLGWFLWLVAFTYVVATKGWIV